MKEKIISYFKDKENILAIIIVAAYYLISYGLVKLFKLFIKLIFSEAYITNHINRISTFINIIFYLLLFSVFVPLSMKKIKDDWTITGKNTSRYAKSIIIGIIIMYGFAFISSIISTAMSSQTSTNQAGLDSMLTSSKLYYWLLFPIVGIIGPICEELVFRHAIFKIFKKDTISIIVSPVLFCLIHMSHQEGGALAFFAVAINYFSAGLALSLCYKLSNKNIYVPVFLHILNNIISLFLVGLI